MSLDFGIILLVFGVIFVAELPDKSLFAALVLGTRYPAFWVWLGAALAFLAHVIIAVFAGKLLGLLPHNVTEIIVAILFFAGAMLLFFGKHGLEDKPTREPKAGAHSRLRVFSTAFSVIFIGEWGDITQIATANYAAKFHNGLSVAIGATAGLWAVTALAIVAGTKALEIIPAKVLLRVMGCVMLVFAILSLVSAFR
jgi:putative Ca2+/H+ antiporter (TMEM165/GDT1 family)